jgi:hypothetical protein
MEKITNVFNEIKERLSNPLFFSFILAWLIINWNIPLSLLFYKIDELKLDGYNSYKDLIRKNYSVENYLGKPALAAIIYTFGYPFLRNCILAFDAWIKSWGSIWRLKSSKDGKISVTQYMKLKHNYEERTRQLENVIEKEMVYLNKTVQLNDRVNELTEQNNNILEELNRCKSTHDVTILDGEWSIIYPKKGTITRIRIKHNQINYIDNSNDDSYHIEIVSLTRNYETRRLIFTTFSEDKNINRTRLYHFFNFELIDDLNYLRGMEDGIIPCELKKIKN